MRESAFRRRWLIPLAAATTLGVATLWQFEPRVAGLWLNTAWLAAAASLIALPLGGLATLIIHKSDAPGRRAAMLLFMGMLFIPLYLVAGAWDAGFGLQGWHTLASDPHLTQEPWLSGWRAAIWVHALAAVPWVVLIVGAGLRAVEAEIEEDAATCATPAQVLLHVTLRHSAAAFVVAGLWIAVVVTAEISVTDFFQVRTFAEEVYTQAALGTFDVATDSSSVDSQASRLPLRASGLWFGLLLSTALAVATIVIAGQLFMRTTDSPHRPPWIAHIGPWRWLAGIVLWAIILLVAGVPLGNLFYKAGVRVVAAAAADANSSVEETSPRKLIRTWSAAKVVERIVAAPAEFRGDLWLSTRIGVTAATAAIALAVPLAWSMRAARGIPWLRLAILAMCLTIPGPLLGVGLIHLLNRPDDSPLAMLAWLYDTNFAPWLVQTIRALPLATLILWPALASVPQAMLDTAATDGSGTLGRLFRIALPQRWPALAAAWLNALAIAMGELAATVLVIPPQPSTAISVRIFQLLHYGVDDRVAAISLLMVAVIVTLTMVATKFVNDELTNVEC